MPICPTWGPAVTVVESSLFLHVLTRAMMDMTFASGPVVAATRGMTVEATHQSLSSS
jgi:hypothetical protein